MTKQGIIDLFKSVADKKDNSGTYIIQDIYFGGIADELLAMFEQEKKEQAREIFVKLVSYFLTYNCCQHDKSYNYTIKIGKVIDCVENLAKEYEVEL